MVSLGKLLYLVWGKVIEWSQVIDNVKLNDQYQYQTKDSFIPTFWTALGEVMSEGYG